MNKEKRKKITLLLHFKIYDLDGSLFELIKNILRKLWANNLDHTSSPNSPLILRLVIIYSNIYNLELFYPNQNIYNGQSDTRHIKYNI